MTIQLMCTKSPRNLGIIDKAGRVDMEKLEEHVHACSECRPYYRRAVLDFLHKIIQQSQDSRYAA